MACILVAVIEAVMGKHLDAAKGMEPRPREPDHIAASGARLLADDGHQRRVVAKQKGLCRHPRRDAFELAHLERSFETVLDCGLFHTLDRHERPR